MFAFRVALGGAGWGGGSSGSACGGVRAGEPHHRQLFPVDARLGGQRRLGLADLAEPAGPDRPHNRAAYAKWWHAQQAGTATPGTHLQFDTTAVLPYYAYLAATGAFLENHCSGFGTNSTPNHLLIVGGQTPTLRNPLRAQAPPVWDMPSLLGHAGEHGSPTPGRPCGPGGPAVPRSRAAAPS